jgi:protein arginine N-methyltransferase 2
MNIKEYINTELIFNDNYIKINDPNCNCDKYIMMDWETPIMKKHADIVCQNGGDILEIGFGMGISANFIINNNINSYTIVEIHPQIIEKVKEWMKDKNNVILIEGDWYEMQDEIKKRKYDGIFIDTIYDSNNYNYLKDIILDIIKPNGIFTYFNTLGNDTFGFGKDNINYEVVEKLNPVENNYFPINKTISKVPWINF